MYNLALYPYKFFLDSQGAHTHSLCARCIGAFVVHLGFAKVNRNCLILF